MSALQPVSFSKRRTPEPRLSEPYVPGRQHERFWTEAEREILRRHYPNGGAKACSLHLPGRPIGSIFQQANKLGLYYQAGRGGGPKQKFESTPELDERIRAEWGALDHEKRGGHARLANVLGITRRVLYKRALELGLDVRPHKKEPAWTKAEDELMGKVPLHKPELAARIFKQHGFNRSPTAIVVRCKRLELSRRATRKELSATRAAAILGMDSKNLTVGYIIPGQLKAVKRQDKRLPQQGGSAWDIERSELRRFVIDNLERIDFRKVDKFALVDLLVNTPAELQAESCEAAQ